jgi:hypothetical protein
LLGDLLVFRSVQVRAQLQRDIARDLLLQGDDVRSLRSYCWPPDFRIVLNVGEVGADLATDSH